MYLFLLQSVLQDAGPAGISFGGDDPDPSMVGRAGGSEDQTFFTFLCQMPFLPKPFSMPKYSRHPTKNLFFFPVLSLQSLSSAGS